MMRWDSLGCMVWKREEIESLESYRIWGCPLLCHIPRGRSMKDKEENIPYRYSAAALHCAEKFKNGIQK